MSLRILDPGLHTLLVDRGRPSCRSLGIPIGGAADRTALALGNALVGNPPGMAALEISLAGPVVQAECELACVVFGAPFDLTSERQRLRAGTTFTLEAGETLYIGGTRERARAYFCVHGGFDCAPVLNSCAEFAPLTAERVLACSPGRMRGRYIGIHAEPLSMLRTLPGAQGEWLDQAQFYRQSFMVTPAANRQGLRLEGEPLRRFREGELLSEPVCPGTVQVMHDGRAIILGVDGQTIGGYPKVAQVISADLDKVGQLRPGDRVRFVRVSLAQAETFYRQKQAALANWVTRLQATLAG